MKPLRTAFSYLFALLMTLGLMALSLLLPLRGMTGPALLTRTLTNAEVLAAAGKRLETEVTDLGERLHFSPEAALSSLDAEAFSAYGEELAAWAARQLSSAAETPPTLDTATLEAAVREDALFQASYPAGALRTVSRDQVGWEIKQLALRAILPIRTSLLPIAQQTLQELPSRPSLQRLWAVLPWALGAVCLCCFGLLLLCQRGLRPALRWSGYTLLTVAMLLALLVLAVHRLQLPQFLCNGNEVLLLELRLLYAHWQRLMLLPLGGTLAGALVLLAVGHSGGRA